MDFESVKLWLTNHIHRQIRNRRMLACLGFVLLPFATVIGILLIYGFLWAIRHHQDRQDEPGIDTTCLWVAFGIVLVMFVINLLISRKTEPEKYYHEDSDADDSVLGHYAHSKKIQLKFFLWIIMTGPRLLTWSIDSLKEISRLKNQDIHSCSALLWLLTIKGRKVPYEQTPRELDWLDVEATLSQLQHFPGVVFLKTPPPGISLTEDLRKAIRAGTPI